jgi:hypothetical protein
VSDASKTVVLVPALHFLFDSTNALSIEQPAIIEETLRLNRWGSVRAVPSFKAGHGLFG